MSAEVTPESMQAHADWLEHHGEVDAADAADKWAAHLRREQAVPGQTAADAWFANTRSDDPWGEVAAAVLAAHGSTLTPIGGNPQPGTRGLLPVVLSEDGLNWMHIRGGLRRSLYRVGDRWAADSILADPRTGGVR